MLTPVHRNSTLAAPIKGHTKRCDQCVQCNRPVPGKEGQGGGGEALTTPDSATSREQETGGSGRVKVNCLRACGGGLRLRKRAMPVAWGAISDRTALLCSPYDTGRPAVCGTDRSHCTHWSHFLVRAAPNVFGLGFRVRVKIKVRIMEALVIMDTVGWCGLWRRCGVSTDPAGTTLARHLNIGTYKLCCSTICHSVLRNLQRMGLCHLSSNAVFCNETFARLCILLT